MSSVKNANQRLKILYLYDILLKKTDEEHPISMPEIVRELGNYGISAERKALYEDIEALRTYGLDIISIRGKKTGYYIGSRDFELPELKLLADAVSSSRFLTEKKSGELLKKIEGLTSVHNGKQLHRQVFVANRVKAINEKIYINMDVIQRAIDEGKKISFDYFDYALDKSKKFREGKSICSPYAFAWDDEKYYLISQYEKYNSITNFRVDRMENVCILSENAIPLQEKFSLADYLNSTFSMFSGSEQSVKLRFDNSLINTVIDRFGKNIMTIPDGKDSFIIRVNVKTQRPFFAWLFQFGAKAKILEPESVRKKYADMLSEAIDNTEK